MRIAAMLVVAASAVTVATSAVTTSTLHGIAERHKAAPPPTPPVAFVLIGAEVRTYETTSTAEALRLYRAERAREARNYRETRDTAIREEKTT